jgi:hypothetical protein
MSVHKVITLLCSWLGNFNWCVCWLSHAHTLYILHFIARLVFPKLWLDMQSVEMKTLRQSLNYK